MKRSDALSPAQGLGEPPFEEALATAEAACRPPLLPGKKASLHRLVGRLSFTEVRTGRLERGHGVVVIDDRKACSGR